MKFLSHRVSIGQKVKALVKSEPDLIAEGWKRTKSGGLKKDGVFFKFTTKKLPTMGKVVAGTIEVNPAGNICIIAENGWGYDESMITSFIPDTEAVKPSYGTLDIEISGVYVRGEDDGAVRLSIPEAGHDGDDVDVVLSEKDTKNLMKNLATYYGWLE